MTKKQLNKNKILLPFGALLLAVGYGAWALTLPLFSIAGQTTVTLPTKQAEKVALNWPEYGQSAIGVAGYGVLATHGDQKSLSTASIAKVMTAVAVLRQRPLKISEQGPEITLNQVDVDSYNNFVANDGSVVGVALGEHISEYQALQALLLPSANNMADTLARWAFGSIDAYTTYANKYASQLGLSSIKIADASGYDVDTVASAHDLTLLGTLAMDDPVFAEIVAQPSAKIPVQGTIYNYNFQLGKSGNIGIKTGNNDGNKGAFLFANKQTVDGQEVTIVGTIMGAPDLSSALKDSTALALSAAKGFGISTFVRSGDKVGSYNVPEHGAVDAVVSSDLSFLTWKEMGFDTSITLKPLDAATAAATAVGSVTVVNSTTKVTTSVPVRLRTATAQPGIVWRLTHPFGT